MSKINLRVLLTLIFLSFAALSSQAQRQWYKVAENDCGNPSAEPFLIKGESYTFPKNVGETEPGRSCTFGSTVIYAFDKIDIHADYQLDMLFLSDAQRDIRLMADGNEITTVKLTNGKEQRVRIDLPRKAYAYSQLVLIFDAMKGPNAVVSQINLYSSNPQKLIPFQGEAKQALAKTQEFQVDTSVSAESVMPVYAPLPAFTTGVYAPTLSLNGTWEFNGEQISVPGQWSMQGFSIDSAAYGTYKKRFTLPGDWSGKDVKIRFDGVFSESTVVLNGQKVGSHLGGLTAFEYNITPYIQQGENIIEVKVRSESLADMLGSLTQYAAHQLGGITRKVTLFAVPKTHISDLRIVTDLDDRYENADLQVALAVTNTSNEAQNGVVIRVTVNGLPVVMNEKIARIEAGQTWRGVLSCRVIKPLKWDNEHPNLYDMSVEISSGDKTTERINKRFGFREVQVSGNQLLVNGRAVKLRGVCRHESHPLTGRVLTTELHRKDVELYRAANCNFIRTSHYPPSEEFIAICDELGMFVEVEAPVCWIGHHANYNWQTLNYKDPQYYPYVLQANMETIHFYRNNPSVIFWSMANESLWNREFAQVLEYMKKADPTRPNAFHDQGYGGFNNQGSTASIGNIHYPGPNGYKNPAVSGSTRPIVYGEYCHLNVYNRSELVTDPGVRSDWALALAPTWDNMYKTQAVLGGSIWSGIDDIFQMPNGDAVGYGPWGPIDGWRRAKPEYWDMKKVYSPTRIITKELAPSKLLTLEIENRYAFLDFNELTINWRYGNESGISPVSLAPGKNGSFTISIDNPEAANALYVSFTDPRGFVADEYLIPVGRQSQNELPVLKPEATQLKANRDRYEITGSNFSCIISRATGQIVDARRNGKSTLCGGPWLMVLPLDGGGCYPNHNANTPIFNELCSEWRAQSVTAAKDGENVVVKVVGKYKEAKGSYTLTINANGEISTEYDFIVTQDVNPRQWGMVYSTGSKFDTTFWNRDGMWSVYPDDHISRPVGKASLFTEGLPSKIDPRIAPTWSWSSDFNELGSNDFRSTRRNVWYAGVSSSEGSKVTVDSKGKQHWRSWKNGDKVCFLVADFVTAGFEMFLGSYYAPFRKPLKAGDTIKGENSLRLE